MSETKILAFAGSTRKDSVNQKLIDIAAQEVVKAGASVTRLSLADFSFPLFNQDLEKDGTPDSVQQLRQMFLDHDGLLIAAPEYNSSITPLLKNTIDWVSRATDDLPPCIAYKGKVVGLMSASPGALGGLRGLVHVRSIFQNIGAMVVPDQFALPRAHEAFNDDGQLKDEKQMSLVAAISQSVVDVASKLKA